MPFGGDAVQRASEGGKDWAYDWGGRIEGKFSNMPAFADLEDPPTQIGQSFTATRARKLPCRLGPRLASNLTADLMHDSGSVEAIAAL